MQRCNRKGKVFDWKCMKSNSARKHRVPPGGNSMQLEEMRGVGGCVGEGGGGGGREGKGRRENAVERGRETRHTPEKLSISSPLELFETKGKTNKQNKQLNWRVSGALVCWVCAPEWDVCGGGRCSDPDLPLWRCCGPERLHCTFSWLPPGKHLLACILHRGNSFPCPFLRGCHSTFRPLHDSLTIAPPPRPQGTWHHAGGGPRLMPTCLAPPSPSLRFSAPPGKGWVNT